MKVGQETPTYLPPRPPGGGGAVAWSHFPNREKTPAKTRKENRAFTELSPDRFRDFWVARPKVPSGRQSAGTPTARSRTGPGLTVECK
jgi:hypothetical protein